MSTVLHSVYYQIRNESQYNFASTFLSVRVLSVKRRLPSAQILLQTKKFESESDSCFLCHFLPTRRDGLYKQIIRVTVPALGLLLLI